MIMTTRIEPRYELKVICQAIGAGHTLLAQGESPIAVGNCRTASRQALAICQKRLLELESAFAYLPSQEGAKV